jgi:hypothetical protein
VKHDSPIERLRQVRGRLREYVRSGREIGRALVVRADPPSSVQRHEDLPVVSRLMLEIRSDGSRTVARGAMESVDRGERVAIQAAGNTPAELVGSLTKALLKAPWLAFQAVRDLQSNTPQARGTEQRSAAPGDDER